MSGLSERCQIEGCTRDARARGWCSAHYEKWRRLGDPTAGRTHSPLARPRTLMGLFWSKVRASESGCWLWHGAINTNGYGRFRARDRAHRFAYETFVGAIPPELEIDHLCRVRNCVNPDHLEAVTRSENVRRGLAPSLARERARAKTHCPQGHAYDEANTYVSSEGKRACRTCRRDARRRYDLAERIDPALSERRQRTLARARANAKAWHAARRQAS